MLIKMRVFGSENYESQKYFLRIKPSYIRRCSFIYLTEFYRFQREIQTKKAYKLLFYQRKNINFRNDVIPMLK